MALRLLLVVALVGCGRLGFEPLSGDGDGDGDGDAALGCDSCPPLTFCDRDRCVSGAAGGRLTTGFGFTCAIDNGNLRCAGRNALGQLGVGDTEQRTSLTRVGADADWAVVVAGQDHACGLRDDRSLWCWGANDRSQLGQPGSNEQSNSPVQIGTDTDWIQLAVGHDHACLRKTDGTLWCFGNNLEAQLGQGNRGPNEGVATPTQVGSETDWTEISAGRGHTCGLRAGALFCWGSVENDQQGNPNGGDDVMQSGADTDWLEVSAGTEHTCARKTDGSVWCWGSNGSGQLGLGDFNDRPTHTLTSERRAVIDSHIFHRCAIDSATGELGCTGRSIEGQLGIDDSADQSNPVMSSPGIGDWVEVAAGRFHSCARRSDGSVWCTGENESGELALGDRDRRNAFTQIQALD